MWKNGPAIRPVKRAPRRKHLTAPGKKCRCFSRSERCGLNAHELLTKPFQSKTSRENVQLEPSSSLKSLRAIRVFVLRSVSYHNYFHIQRSSKYTAPGISIANDVLYGTGRSLWR